MLYFSAKLRSNAMPRALAAGRVRKVATGIYSDDLTSPLEEITRLHRLEILAHL